MKTFTILTTNTTNVGTYSIKISGSLTHDGGVLTMTDLIWTVTIVKLCTAMVITTSNVSDQVYKIGEPPKTFSFNNWTEDVNTCGVFVYIHKLASGAIAPSFITLDSPTRTFSVSSSDPTTN